MNHLFAACRQKAAAAWAALPAAARWLAAGIGLLAAILLGGAITAYGGTFLLLLLWAICMGGLVLLLQTAWRLAFPGERLRNEKAFLTAFALGAALGVAVIAGLVFYRQTVYGEDAINYYAKQQLLLGSFANNGFYGVHLLAENLLAADYKMFLSLFITLPYLLFPRTINAFMLSYTLACFLPAWFALLMVAKKVRQLLGPGPWGQKVPAHGMAAQGKIAQDPPALGNATRENPAPGRTAPVRPARAGWYYGVCMLAMVLWPVFLWPATHGMPDAFGLTFVAVILLLTADYRFESLPAGRLLALFAATFALVLTRRWYMFWILAYYLLYALAVLAGAARQKQLGKTLWNMLRFGVPALLGIVLPLVLTFRTILTTDYADIYGSYYGGGFLANCLVQLNRQGLGFWILCGAGLAVAVCRKAARWPAAVVSGASLLAMVLFTRTQSMGDHQALILAPACLVLLFCVAASLCNLRADAAARWGAGALAAFFCLNGANALRVPGATLQTPLLSGVALDLTRRTDLAQMAAVTDFVTEHCTENDTVYINLDSDGYSGSTFAYSDTTHPALQSIILWENSVPSTHGFPTGIWSSKYVMVTDKTEEGGLVGGVNTALRTATPAAGHYTYVTEFALDGVTLYCYERTAPPDAAEADYFKALFAAYDARWPALYSERIDAYLAENAG